MSAYKQVTTQITNQDCLVRSLGILGFQPEIYPIAKNLTGYQGDNRLQKANVILPRKQVGGASNDIGFEMTASGNFDVHISDYDSHVYNSKWMDKLMTNYSTQVVTDLAQQSGYSTVEDTTVITNSGTKRTLKFEV